MAQKKIVITVDSRLFKTLGEIAKLKKDDVNAIFTEAAQKYVLENSCLLAEEIERLKVGSAAPVKESAQTNKAFSQEKDYNREGKNA